MIKRPVRNKAITVLLMLTLLLAALPAAMGQEQATLEDARIFESLAVKLYNQDKYDMAIPLAEQALLIRKSLQGENHSDYARCLNTLAVLYGTVGRHADAEPLLLKAVEITEKMGGEGRRNYAATLTNLAEHYASTDRFSEAEQTFLKATKVLKEEPREKQIDLVTILGKFAQLYLDNARPAEAELLYHEALDIIRTSYGENSTHFADGLTKLAKFYRSAGRYADAGQLFLRVAEILKGELGEKHPRYAAALYDQAGVYADTGRYAEAEALYLKARENTKLARGEEHPDYAIIINGQALLYDKTGRYAEAEPLYLKATEIFKIAYGETSAAYGISLGNLAVLYQHMQRNAESESLNLKAVEILKKALGEQHLEYAASVNNLARLYDSVGRYSEAESLYRKAIEIQRKRLGEKHPTYGMGLNNLALLYHRMGRYAEAEPLYLKTLEIKAETLGKNHASYATGVNNLGALYDRMGLYAKAEPLLLKALELRRKALGDDHPDCAQTLGNLSGLYEATGRPHEALSALTRALEIEEHNLHMVFSGSSEAAMLQYSAAFHTTLEGMLSFARAQQQTYPEAVAAALTWTLRRKGITLDTLIRFRQAQVLAQSDLMVTKKVADLRRLRQNLSDLALNPPKGTDEAVVRQEMSNLRDKANLIEAELNRALNAAQAQNDAEVSIAAVRRRLAPGSVLVEFIRSDILDSRAKGESYWQPAHYFAFVLDADPQLPPRMIDLGEAARIDTAVSKLREHISTTKNFLKGRTEQQLLEAEQIRADGYRQVAKDLYDLVFAPMWRELRKAKTLYIAPDSQLTLVPFEALVADSGEGAKYLVEEYRFAYLTSGRDLLRAANQSGRGTVVFADPDYDLTAEKRAAESNKLRTLMAPSATPLTPTANGSRTGMAALGETQVATGTGIVYQGALSRDLMVRGDGSVWRRLKSSKQEAAAVIRELAGTKYSPVVDYIGERALEDVLKRIHSPRVLHLATHGFFLPDQPAQNLHAAYGVSTPQQDSRVAALGLTRLDAASGESPLLRAGLVLAGANQLGEQPPQAMRVEDGWLTAEEAAFLELSGTELVVLSACGTGLGTVAAGEGVFGLRRALRLAGASTIVSTLFEVPDQESADLMRNFYAGLRGGQGKLEALRGAQLRLINKRRAASGVAHPFFWAGFVLTGDPN